MHIYYIALLLFSLTALADAPVEKRNIVAMGDFTCASGPTKAVKCWGYNLNLQTNATTFDAENLAGGLYRACSANTFGQIQCWGGLYGPPIELGAMFSDLADMGMGDEHVCALTKAGSVSCWGGNDMGQVGNGNTIANYRERHVVFAPSPVISLDQNVASLSVNQYYACAATVEGKVLCWGNRDEIFPNDKILRAIPGEESKPGRLNHSIPLVIPGTGQAKSVSCGVTHTCVVTTGGEVMCWGLTANFVLGDPTDFKFKEDDFTPKSVVAAPVKIKGLSGVVKVQAGYAHSCAILNDGSMKCWGSNAYGVLGTGNTDTDPNLLPVTSTVIKEKVKSVSLGNYHTCVELESGTKKCWGRNDQGQLGDGTKVDSLLPVDVKF